MTTAEPLTEEQEVFLKHIQRKGLKRTSQRDLILDVFLRTEEHLSNEDLYQLVKKEDPTVGQTTVYRTLKILTEAGLAREVRFSPFFWMCLRKTSCSSVNGSSAVVISASILTPLSTDYTD